jgi:hypothetical protein
MVGSIARISFMRKLSPILRCKCASCVGVRRRWFFVILAVCIAIVGSWKILVEEHKSVSAGDDQYSVDAGVVISRGGFNESSVVDTASEISRLCPPMSVANSDSSKPRVSRELFNAELAAGLIDPSRIGIIEPAAPAPSPAQERAVSLSGPAVNIQNPARGKESAIPLVNVAAAKPAKSAADNPTKPMDAVSPLALATNRIVSVSPKQSAEAEPDGRTHAPYQPESHREVSGPRNKQVSSRFVARAGISSLVDSSGDESMSRKNPLADGAKPESSNGPKTDNHDPQSRELSENLRRFASDFVRANQSDNISEQHRFFADSVHFYSEGDLSLASVAAATRRYHRDQQTKRSEVAAPAAAVGPVNGGFFEIEQPVRWTQSQGSKVTQGRSVLRLRVFPANHGGWKITSIDEVNK